MNHAEASFDKFVDFSLLKRRKLEGLPWFDIDDIAINKSHF